MSGGQIGTIIGGAIGFATGLGPTGVSIAMSLGGVAGSLLMPDKVGLQDQYGARLTDLKTTSSTYGVSIKKVFGSYRIGGNMIWANDIKETKHVREEEVGKGGSETYTVTTYTYSVDMAVAFCEGPVSGVRKIWADSVLIYDVSVGGTTDAYQASEQLSGKMSIYLGTSTQNVDWLLESYNPDTPAYRNVCYITFSSFQLEKYGNRIPNITAEIVKDGQEVNEEQEIVLFDHVSDLQTISGFAYYKTPPGPSLNSSNSYYIVHEETDASSNVTGTYIISKYSTHSGMLNYAIYTHPLTGIVNSSVVSGDRVIVSFGDGDIEYFYLFNPDLTIENSWIIYGANDPNWTNSVACGYSDNTLVIAASSYDYIITSNDLTSCDSPTGLKDPRGDKFIYGTDLDDLDAENTLCVGDDKICIFSYDATSSLGSVVRIWDFNSGVLLNTVDCNSAFTGNHFGTYDTSTKLINNNILYSYYSDVTLKTGNLLTIDLLTYTIIDSVSIPQPNNFTQYAPSGFYNNGVIHNITNSTGFHSIKVNAQLQANQVGVDTVIEELIAPTGIDLSEVDTTQLSSIYLDGFVVNDISSTRSSISVLQSVYFFDLIEEDFLIKAKIRSSIPVKTITDTGANSDTDIIHKKELVTAFPKKVTFSYANKDIDYQISSQSSQRIDGSSQHNTSLSLSLAINDDKAKQLTEIYLYNAWAAKDTFEFSMPLESNSNISCGNAVGLNYNDLTVIVRITKILFTTNYIMKCESVKDSSYLSNAVGQNTSAGFIPYILGPKLPSNLFVFNAPVLKNAYLNSVGVYYVASGQSSSWQGCVVYKSKDNGQTYKDIGVIFNDVPFGSSYTALPNGTVTSIDTNNIIKVKIISGTLDSITFEELISGKNYIKIGDEVLQYQNATYLGNNEYELDTLLRGRRGTEWAAPLHTNHEKFVFLDPIETQFDFATYNLARRYKAVTFGTYLEDVGYTSHTNDGTNLKPFSPSDATPREYSGTTITIKWIRRDRYISGYFRNLPMSESVEEYNLYIYNTSMTLIRTELGLSTNEFVYTSALRVTDGLSGTISDKFYYEVAQVSSVIGEGVKALFFVEVV